MHFHIAATICRKDCLALLNELAKLYSRKKKEVRDTKGTNEKCILTNNLIFL